MRIVGLARHTSGGIDVIVSVKTSAACADAVFVLQEITGGARSARPFIRACLAV